MSKPTVLIVEDEYIEALALKGQLSGLGFEVADTCETAREAVDKAATLVPDLVLMDIRLGDGMDGIAAASHLRTMYNVPVVFVTAHSDETTVNRAMHSEPFGYIVKPYDERVLKTTVEMALYKHKMEQHRKHLASAVIGELIRSQPKLD